MSDTKKADLALFLLAGKDCYKCKYLVSVMLNHARVDHFKCDFNNTKWRNLPELLVCEHWTQPKCEECQYFGESSCLCVSNRGTLPEEGFCDLWTKII